MGDTKLRALTADIAPRSSPGRHTSIGSVRQIFPSKWSTPCAKSWKKARERAVDMGTLSALVAKRARQRRAAIEAIGLVRAPLAFAGPRLDRPAEHAASHYVRHCSQFAHRHPIAHLMRAVQRVLAPTDGAHRPPRRLLQSGPSRAPAHQPPGDARARSRRNLVARFAGQSSQGRRQRHGRLRSAFRSGARRGARLADPCQ